MAEKETFAPAENSFEGIDLEKVLRCAVKSFQFLVCGKTGVGKSSLINSIVGAEVCAVNDPAISGSFGAGTVGVEETRVNLENILVSIWDSPGLQDGTDNEEKYLEDMHNKCKDVDIVFYCMDMNTVRWTPPEVKATKLLSDKFGVDFWKKVILVLTKANTVRAPAKYKEKEYLYHKQLFKNFRSKFQAQLVEQGVPEEVTQNLRTVAAGFCDPSDKNEKERFIYCASDQVEPSKDNEQSDFLAELWAKCFEILSGLSRAQFVKMTRKRIKLPEGSMSEEDKKVMKLLEESLNNEKELRKQLEEKDKQIFDKYQSELAALRSQLAELRRPSPDNSSKPVCVGEPGRGNSLGKAAAGAAVGAAFGGLPGAIIGGIFSFFFS